MAEHLYVSPGTVVRLETGDATARLGIFLTAAWVLGFDRKLADIFDPYNVPFGLKRECVDRFQLTVVICQVCG